MSQVIKTIDLEEEQELKNVRLFLEINKVLSNKQVEDLEDSILSIFSLSEFKVVDDGKHKITLKSLNPGIIPNLSITLSYFYKKLHEQSEYSEFVGFYQLIKSFEFEEGDIIDLGFESNTALGINEIPLEIEDFNTEITLIPSVERAIFEKAVIKKEVFEKILKEEGYIRKYQKLEEKWFDEIISNIL